ncbi:Chymotrypsin-1 [Bulinus truncatus]|nr:Chymotrypsin-1 [Bulinus truncatus]
MITVFVVSLLAVILPVTLGGHVISPAGLSMIQRLYNETSQNRERRRLELFSRPYQALASKSISRRTAGSIFCGAVIIDDDRVLTAAHCLLSFPADILRVEVGVLNLRAPPLEYTQYLDVLSVRPNEGFSMEESKGYPNDIGLVYLKNSIQFNANVQPAKIAPGGTTFDDQECVVSGWGRLWYNGPLPAHLQEAKMRKMSYAQCLAAHERIGLWVDQNHLCVIGEADENGNAPVYVTANSGGPMLCGEKRHIG